MRYRFMSTLAELRVDAERDIGRTFGPRCELEEPALLTRRTVSATVELGPATGGEASASWR